MISKLKKYWTAFVTVVLAVFVVLDHRSLEAVRKQLHDAPVVSIADVDGGHKLGSLPTNGGGAIAPGTSGQVYVSNATPAAVWTSLINYDPVHGRFTSGGGGTDYKVLIGAVPANETTDVAAYLLANGDTANNSNFALGYGALCQTFASHAGSVCFNARGAGSVYGDLIFTNANGNASTQEVLGHIDGVSGILYAHYGVNTSAGLTAGVFMSGGITPTVLAGTSATSITFGCNNAGCVNSLSYGANTNAWTVGGNGFAPGVGTQSLAAGGSITPTSTVLANPYIKLTGSEASNTTVVLPNAVGMWWFDISGLTFNGHTLAFSSGSTTSSTLSSLVTTTEIVQVFAGGSNTIAINL